MFFLLIPAAALFTSLTTSAQTPTPPPGGLPSANRLQELHGMGRDAGSGAFKAESFGNRPPSRENLEHQLDTTMKSKGSTFSETEREVFTEAYWKAVSDEYDDFDGGKMTEIDPPTIMPPPDTGPTTTVSGKTSSGGPGTVQLTDKDGNTFFVDVDKDGNYSRTVPLKNFTPTRMILRTATTKTAWGRNEGGKWTEISSAVGRPNRSDGRTITGGAAYALADKCERHGMLASIEWGYGFQVKEGSESINSLKRHFVRFVPQSRPTAEQFPPFVFWVSDPLPPDIVKEAQRQGIEHADREFEKSELEKIPKSERTKEQTDRLDQLKQQINDYNNAKNSPFANKDAVEITEKAAQARRLQRQAEALRASGTPGSDKAAENILKTADQLMGGEKLPPLGQPTAGGATGTNSGKVTGEVVDQSWNPFKRGMVAGTMIFPEEHPNSLNDPKLDKPLRDEPVDGCPGQGKTNAKGEFKLEYRLDYDWGSKMKWGSTYEYLPTPKAEEVPKTSPESKPTTPTEKSSTQGAFYRTGVGTSDNCAYAYADSFVSGLGGGDGKGLWTIKTGAITLNTDPGYNFFLAKGTQLGVVRDALSAVNIPLNDFTLDQHETGSIGGIGHVQATWASARDFQWKIPDSILGAEEEICTGIAPAPSWDPAHWPTQHVNGLPAFHLQLSHRHE